jgi:hypothetical protein
VKTLPSSTYLDAFANLQASPQQFRRHADVPGEYNAGRAVRERQRGCNRRDCRIGRHDHPALVLNRATDPSTGQPADPTALLASPWGERQAALADQTAIWNTYGADPATYGATVFNVSTALGLVDPALLPTPPGYLATPQDRTIWLTLDAQQFHDLFDADLLQITLAGTILRRPSPHGAASSSFPTISPPISVASGSSSKPTSSRPISSTRRL